MPKFRIHAQQWVQETAELEIEAADENEARRLAEGDDDWDWQDGNTITDFEITNVELIKEDKK